jgi:hypothetical protein
MKTNRLITLLILTLSTLNPQLSTLFAQGTAFTYQGRLNDGANPANGRYDLKFGLFNASTNGTLVSSDYATNSATTVSGGLFTVTLDFGDVFAGPGRWLEIAVRTNGGGAFSTLSPRQQLTSIPYAIRATSANHATSADFANNAGHADSANNAGHADSANSASFANNANSANTAIGATHATSADFANNAGHADSASTASTANTANNANYATSAATAGSADSANNANTANFANSAGTANSVAAANVSGTLADSHLSGNVALRSGGNTFNGTQIITNGSVGLATTSPGRMLQLGGPANTEAMIRLNSTAANGIAGRAWDVGVPKSDTSTDGKFFSFSVQDTAAALPALLIRWDSQYVGISNTNPIALLTVGSSVSPAYCNGTSWVNGSDRNAKENFAPVDAAEVLARVVSLPVQSWSYKAQPDDKHIGPVAQDFHTAFGLNGKDERHIATVDADGVALAAIQGLNQKLEGGSKRAETRIEKLETENTGLKKRLSELEAIVSKLTAEKE